MAQYITVTIARAYLGTAYETAVTSITGVSATILIEGATSIVQTAMRNSGYAAPDTDDPTEVEDYVQLATVAAYRELLATIPEGAIALPENWATDPTKMALEAIRSGDAKLEAEPEDAGAVGGHDISEGNPDVDGAFEQRSSRENLSGF